METHSGNFGGQMAATFYVHGCRDSGKLLSAASAIARQYKGTLSVCSKIEPRSFRSSGDNPYWLEDASLVLRIGSGGTNQPTEARQRQWLDDVVWSTAHTLAKMLPRQTRISCSVAGLSPDLPPL